jgi:hypothetical protein
VVAGVVHGAKAVSGGIRGIRSGGHLKNRGFETKLAWEASVNSGLRE